MALGSYKGCNYFIEFWDITLVSKGQRYFPYFEVKKLFLHHQFETLKSPLTYSSASVEASKDSSDFVQAKYKHFKHFQMALGMNHSGHSNANVKFLTPFSPVIKSTHPLTKPGNKVAQNELAA